MDRPSELNRREWNSPDVVAVYASRTGTTPPPPSSTQATAPGSTAAAPRPHPMDDLLPADLTGLRVLEVACAGGGYARKLAGRGASVVAMDISEGLVDIARGHEQRAPLRITYGVHDLMRPLPAALGPFDAAVSIMTVMDVEDPIAAVQHLARAVSPGGLLAFSLPHPGFHVEVTQGEWGWGVDLPSYFDRTRTRRRVIAARDGSGRTAAYTQFHRTLGDYLGALTEERFCLERFVELPDSTLLIGARRHASS
jgi:2-polyprenyl-3-methyl-5-hydroxy-6-metoxy-1,4-benzoquinol methylase